MIIPKLHYISEGDSPKQHLANIQKACSSGAELVQLHLNNVSEKKVLKIATAAREMTSHFQTRLIINNQYKIAKAIKADGVHLNANDVCPTLVRKQLYSWQMVGATVHTLEDCEHVVSKTVDYVYLSPFKNLATTNISSETLGLQGFEAIVDELSTETPILGYGGITTDDVHAILKTGISGVAVSEGITQNFDLIKIFHQLLNASSTAEMRHVFKPS
ncbi:thiamine phosphate synthase [Psychroserpens sp.]|uniref:thiamine phosphate synthase n=1 Tax=Psychroserpens sp. TaxID=2020870 RepID=UPI003C77C82A